MESRRYYVLPLNCFPQSTKIMTRALLCILSHDAECNSITKVPISHLHRAHCITGSQGGGADVELVLREAEARVPVIDIEDLHLELGCVILEYNLGVSWLADLMV